MSSESISKEVTHIRIHPGIGISRLGNSTADSAGSSDGYYFVGPEAPGIVVNPGGSGPGPGGGTYRDQKMKLKRQAQRFRIYGYDSSGNCVQELTNLLDGVNEIKWRVHVQNLKAANYAFQGAYLFDPTELRNPSIQPGLPPEKRDKLIINPGVHTVSGSDKSTKVMKGNVFTDVEDGTLPGYLRYDCYEPNNRDLDVNVTYTEKQGVELGQIKTDDAGRLIFIPGPGESDCVTTPRLELSNPSADHVAPNGPDDGKDPLTNQFAYFNVPGWWDDTCGGEIDVTVETTYGTFSTRNDDGSRNGKKGGWVVSAPPKYSPYMYHVVSLLDRVYEAFPDAYPNAGSTKFYRDVYPILSKATNYGWVSAEAAGVDPSTRNMAHGPKQPGNLLSRENMRAFTDTSENGAPARKGIYALMRYADAGPNNGTRVHTLKATLPKKPPPAPADPPILTGNGAIARGNKMPKLWGTGGKPLQNQQLGHNEPNQYLSLTDWQLKHLKDWADGNFEVEPGVQPMAPPQLEDINIADQPRAMDEAALEPTIGGGFHPGIEFPYLICYPELFDEAFRVKTGTTPGSVAAFMSSPWQGDYWSCNVAWWPVQRPDIVFQYDEKRTTRTYKEWFRGYDMDGNPLSQTDGYDQMVYAWPGLGMVLPSTNSDDVLPNWEDDRVLVTDNGSVVYQEYERGSYLDEKNKSDDCS